MGKSRIALALGSGATRGWAHIWLIDVLTEAGIVLDIICGSSMGALVSTDGRLNGRYQCSGGRG
ncbi:MAG: patatin-like phospholipase family protein [Candidatus Devosia symbiotica]|nr:patatin-like phospholipase family protein [Candidatus Devosia symbiotica]